MKPQATKAVLALVIVYSLCLTLPIGFAQDYSVSFQLLDEQGENAGYTLNVVVPETLLQYYQERSHRLSTLADFTTFVTPYAVNPIADCLRQIYPDDEDFANGALMIVHQMNYVETKQGKYPAETLADNRGDCDVFSYVAASIIVAGGIDVILLDYEEQAHMNIGVHLASQPKDAREDVYKIPYENADYYIAETTGGNWTRGWRVGECPDNVKGVEAKVLTLENAELIAPGQVSASFTKLEDSDISLEIWPSFAFEQGTVTLRGSLVPMGQDQNVTIYLGVSGRPWTILGTAQTRADGSYEYVWKTTVPGVYGVRASWAGDSTFAGSSTSTLSAFVVPLLLGALILVSIIVVVIGVIAAVASRHSKSSRGALGEPEPSVIS